MITLMNLQLGLTIKSEDWEIFFYKNKSYTYEQLEALWFVEVWSVMSDLIPTEREYPDSPIVDREEIESLWLSEWWIWNCRFIALSEERTPWNRDKEWVVVYHYKSWSYDWDGEAYHLHNWKILSTSMSHCSCYWPWDNSWHDCSIDDVGESARNILLQFL